MFTKREKSSKPVPPPASSDTNRVLTPNPPVKKPVDLKAPPKGDKEHVQATTSSVKATVTPEKGGSVKATVTPEKGGTENVVTEVKNDQKDRVPAPETPATGKVGHGGTPKQSGPVAEGGAATQQQPSTVQQKEKGKEKEQEKPKADPVSEEDQAQAKRQEIRREKQRQRRQRQQAYRKANNDHNAILNRDRYRVKVPGQWPKESSQRMETKHYTRSDKSAEQTSSSHMTDSRPIDSKDHCHAHPNIRRWRCATCHQPIANEDMDEPQSHPTMIMSGALIGALVFLPFGLLAAIHQKHDNSSRGGEGFEFWLMLITCSMVMSAGFVGRGVGVRDSAGGCVALCAAWLVVVVGVCCVAYFR